MLSNTGMVNAETLQLHRDLTHDLLFVPHSFGAVASYGHLGGLPTCITAIPLLDACSLA